MPTLPLDRNHQQAGFHAQPSQALAPTGQYYARVEGKIVLVDARTEMPVKVVRAG